ncbi:transcriptional regulator, GntR family [Beutenbergia cavernae DSM 12333]|uniref:Transcriptional regulator, GntR family n=1 Tax=Beutenbergia cavernae (strain ATCC BAA-8 / DSM 12333 / CCUG 43141 / JCM 11478 / NBRC 16432 / NCIMB 13614 / HKI 0122) TaxID=471853 RepID=C5BXV3_BEUC1|nr:GntR family transcriptional regulator [Beutenbergia cavernae]ACQ78847.1 transcriptional regulator, GntR family [Beutenbergia cavernae DSM 12333]
MSTVPSPAPSTAPRVVTARAALRDRIVSSLRQQIIDGDLRAGTRLHERDLSERFGVSRVPVREAIITLSGEGLVDVQPGVGAFVTPLTRQNVREVFEIRAALEPMAARLAALRCTADHLATLQALVAGARDAARVHDAAAGARANADFHEMLFRATGNDLLQTMVPALDVMTRRLFPKNIVHHEAMMWQDHEAITRAIELGDAERAAELAAAHLENTRRHTFEMFERDAEL